MMGGLSHLLASPKACPPRSFRPSMRCSFTIRFSALGALGKDLAKRPPGWNAETGGFRAIYMMCKYVHIFLLIIHMSNLWWGRLHCKAGNLNSWWILVLRSARVVLLLMGVETEVETLLVALEAKNAHNQLAAGHFREMIVYRSFCGRNG